MKFINPNDTAKKLFTGVNDTADKFFAYNTSLPRPENE
jgi:hypothetical protein